MRFRIPLVFFVVCIFAPVCASARHWNVPDDAPTIQAAIDSASTGDVVAVDPGVWSGAGNRDLNFHGKGIEVTGTPGCIINCQGTPSEHHVGFFFNSGEGPSSIVHGFQIINGYSNYGGGIWCINASPTIDYCSFGNGTGGENTAVNYGGGIFCQNGSSPLINKCVFYENTAEAGGGLACYNASPTVVECEFYGNTATEEGGAIIVLETSSPTIRSCYFEENMAPNGGGSWSYDSDLSYIDCTFTGNEAYGIEGAGGGLYCRNGTLRDCRFFENSAYRGGGAFSSETTLDGCYFEENSAMLGGGLYSGTSIVDSSGFFSNVADSAGGGVYCVTWPDEIDFSYCRFHHNSAGYVGGGIAAEMANLTLSFCEFYDDDAVAAGGGLDLSGSVAGFINCGIYQCTSPRGSAVSLRYGSDITMETEIVSGNGPGEPIEVVNDVLFGADLNRDANSTSSASLYCCNVFGNPGGNYVGAIAGQNGINGNFSLNPDFCSPDWGIFSLKECSPCVNGFGCGQIGPYGVACACGVIGIEDKEKIRLGFNLEPNVPNPFNPWTNITYTIPEGNSPYDRVSLKVYDVVGRLVRTLVDTEQPSGTFTVSWNGVDSQGIGVASGVYFCRLCFNGEVKTIRMVLLR